MSLPSPPNNPRGLRLATAFQNPLSQYQTAYEPLVSPTSRSAPRTRKEALKARAKSADKHLHSLPSYQRMKRLRLLSRAISSILNIIMFALMVFTIAIFTSTRHDTILGRTVWPRTPETWPTYMLLAASAFSLLAALGMLVFFYCAYERATRSWKLVLLLTAVEIAFWITISTVYRTEKQRDDLWGWSCTAIAKDLQAGGGSVDFSKLCDLQTVSWFISLGETGLKVLFLIVLILLRRKLKKETGYQKQSLIEMGGQEVVDTIQNFGF